MPTIDTSTVIVPPSTPVKPGWTFGTPTLTMSNIITFLGTLMAAYYALHNDKNGGGKPAPVPTTQVVTPALSPPGSFPPPIPLPSIPRLYAHLVLDASDPVAVAYPTYAAHAGYPCLIVTDANNNVLYANNIPETRADLVALMNRLRNGGK